MYIEKTDLPHLAENFFIQQGLEIKNPTDKTNINFASVGEFAWQDTTLKKNDIRVLLFLSHVCRDKGFTWVSQEYIAKEINIERKYVNRIIRTLEQKQYIRTKQVKQSNNRYNNLTVLTYSPYLKEQYKTSLDESEPGQKRPTGRVKNVRQAGSKTIQEEDNLKGKNNRRTTTNFFDSGLKPESKDEAALDTDSPAKARLNGLTKDQEALHAAYCKHVDEHYIIQPKDRQSIDAFVHTDSLLKYMPYWYKYIGTHDEYRERSGTLDEFDKTHSAKIHVIIKHWNNFHIWAKQRIEAEARKRIHLEYEEYEAEVEARYDELLESISLNRDDQLEYITQEYGQFFFENPDLMYSSVHLPNLTEEWISEDLMRVNKYPHHKAWMLMQHGIEIDATTNWTQLLNIQRRFQEVGQSD